MNNEMSIFNPDNKDLTPAKFFCYRQNNSGGSFVVDDNVTVNVYIQANSMDEANNIAESIGIYFNGCEMGRDCSCCGDRWYRWPTEMTIEEVFKIITNGLFEIWYRDEHSIIHLLSGQKIMCGSETFITGRQETDRPCIFPIGQ